MSKTPDPNFCMRLLDQKRIVGQYVWISDGEQAKIDIIFKAIMPNIMHQLTYRPTQEVHWRKSLEMTIFLLGLIIPFRLDFFLWKDLSFCPARTIQLKLTGLLMIKTSECKSLSFVTCWIITFPDTVFFNNGKQLKVLGTIKERSLFQ